MLIGLEAEEQFMQLACANENLLSSTLILHTISEVMNSAGLRHGKARRQQNHIITSKSQI